MIISACSTKWAKLQIYNIYPWVLILTGWRGISSMWTCYITSFNTDLLLLWAQALLQIFVDNRLGNKQRDGNCSDWFSTFHHLFMFPWLIVCMKHFLVMLTAQWRDDIVRCYNVLCTTVRTLHPHTHKCMCTHKDVILQTCMHKAHLFPNISTLIQTFY